MTRLTIGDLAKIKEILLDKYDPDVLVDLLLITGRDLVDTFEEAVIEYYHDNPDEFSYEDNGD